MGITFSDHLIDSGHYDITPEQECEIEVRDCGCYAPGDCDGSCTHPKPEPEAIPDFHDDEIYEAIEELQSAAVMADQEPMEALFSDTALLVRFLIRQRDQANSEKVRLREALQFYANPEIYKPHPHGPAFDRRDVSYVARGQSAVAENGRRGHGKDQADLPDRRQGSRPL